MQSGNSAEQRRYPPEQMHRIAYTKLTPAQISGRLAAAEGGPPSASELSDALDGQTMRVVTDNGPALDYDFRSRDRLSVSENGASGIVAGYGALSLGHVTLFSHMVPGTQRGYHVIVDQESGLATVVEVWFSGYTDNREVQRQIYFGYVDRSGQPAPDARHRLTNRAEGKGFYWKQDNGVETIEFYPSTIYSNFVELTRFGGELSFCAPSDYVQVDEEHYVYSRTECEFSGVMTLYVFDPNRLEQVGVRLGFDESDALEYYVFRGTGEWLGQIAQFEAFGDLGPAAPDPNAEKGLRRVYRPMLTFQTLTEAEVDRVAVESRQAFESDGAMAGNSGISYNCGPNGLRLSAVGAHSRHAGRFDVARFYGRQA